MSEGEVIRVSREVYVEPEAISRPRCSMRTPEFMPALADPQADSIQSLDRGMKVSAAGEDRTQLCIIVLGYYSNCRLRVWRHRSLL